MPGETLTVKDLFVERVLAGLRPRDALLSATSVVDHLLTQADPTGTELVHMVRALGVHVLFRGSIPGTLPAVRQLMWNMWLEDTPGSVSDVPLPACIESKLPAHRPPTQEEVEEAWRQCVAKSSR